jgi:hypothetical protein
MQMKYRHPHSFRWALQAAMALVACSVAPAALVSMQLQGIVNSSPIAVQIGQVWTLELILDTSAPEVFFTAANPNAAEFFNTGSVKVLRTLDFTVGASGQFEIHLVDPVPTIASEVRIDIDNFGSKSFFAHVDDAAFLPAWSGLQLDNFLLGLEDLLPGGYADGTDLLPGADPTITIDEFTGFKQVRLKLGTDGQFIGTPTSFALASVPEPSTAVLCAMGGMALLGRNRSRVRHRKSL